MSGEMDSVSSDSLTPPLPAVQKKPTSGGEKPTYADMVTNALKGLDEKGGSSRQSIVKYISSHYEVDEAKVNNQIRNAVKRFVKSGLLKQVKGNGASGSFKLSEDFEVKPRKKASPKASVKKVPKGGKAKANPARQSRSGGAKKGRK